MRLDLDQQTEIKAATDAAQVMLYTWHADGEVYTDFHVHKSDAGRAFVRYEEQQMGHEGRGSLLAPFKGEHGWYWLSIPDRPATISLTVTGDYCDVIDYGILN